MNEVILATTFLNPDSLEITTILALLYAYLQFCQFFIPAKKLKC
jgi:hypothetical protein